MYDVAIAGGGLCGLALTKALLDEGLSVILLEARDRLGGRILTRRCASNGLMADLGAGWFWPQMQPLMCELVQMLGLAAFPQYDEGVLLRLHDPETGPQDIGREAIHGGALRLTGGMGALVEALAARLGAADLRLGTRLIQAIDAGDHVGLRVASSRGAAEIAARRLVLAMPPRLVDGIAFTPPLPAALTQALDRNQTWMAASAKAVVPQLACDWRAGGLSGSAFVAHGQAVLAEVFDACDASGRLAGLGGFIALSPEQRAMFAEGLPMLVGNQLSQVFGPGHDGDEIVLHDWADDPLTCAAADRIEPRREHPAIADPLLRQGHWQGRLHFGGSETAQREAGYMEGALDAARRVAGVIREAGRTSSDVEKEKA